MEIDLEINRILDIIKEKKPKKILLQFPDGLKPRSKIIYDLIKENFPNTEVYIWLGETFGGCDVPIWLEKYGFDLIINIGHSKVTIER
ncbi:MAG: diphthamide synthesis protein [Candidatus Aenigmatarchaeota archaeon]